MSILATKIKTKKLGFTLVELSIVLVIIGLLIGGILVGQTMIDSANILKMVKNFQEDTIMINLFKDKFKQLPGDYSRAVEILGANANGNNDEQITEATSVYEHLYKAGITKIPYNSLLAFNGPPPTKYPRMKVGGEYYNYNVSYMGTTVGSTLGGNYSGPSDPFYANRFTMGTATTGRLTPKFAMTLDAKLDNGKPGTGTVRSMNVNQTGYTEGCRTHTIPSEYKLSDERENVCTTYISIDLF